VGGRGRSRRGCLPQLRIADVSGWCVSALYAGNLNAAFAVSQP